MPQARVTCYAASAQRRRREAQARSTGAQRRMCAAPHAQCHLAPLQAARSSWHERSEGHERSPVGVSSRWSCASAGRRERAASEAKQQATVKYIYTYIIVFNYQNRIYSDGRVVHVSGRANTHLFVVLRPINSPQSTGHFTSTRHVPSARMTRRSSFGSQIALQSQQMSKRMFGQ